MTVRTSYEAIARAGTTAAAVHIRAPVRGLRIVAAIYLVIYGLLLLGAVSYGEGGQILAANPELHPQLRKVYDAFGPKRMFWGSDISRLPSTYRDNDADLITQVADYVAGMTDRYLLRLYEELIGPVPDQPM